MSSASSRASGAGSETSVCRVVTLPSTPTRPVRTPTDATPHTISRLPVESKVASVDTTLFDSVTRTDGAAHIVPFHRTIESLVGSELSTYTTTPVEPDVATSTTYPGADNADSVTVPSPATRETLIRLVGSAHTTNVEPEAPASTRTTLMAVVAVTVVADDHAEPVHVRNFTRSSASST